MRLTRRPLKSSRRSMLLCPLQSTMQFPQRDLTVSGRTVELTGLFLHPVLYIWLCVFLCKRLMAFSYFSASGADANAASWTTDEQKLLEQALKTYPVSTAERWEKIAAAIPGRTKKDCMKRYKVSWQRPVLTVDVCLPWSEMSSLFGMWNWKSVCIHWGKNVHCCRKKCNV